MQRTIIWHVYQYINSIDTNDFHHISIGDDDDDDEDGDDEEREERLPSCLDYVMHFLTIFWKVLFAFVPPTGRNCLTFIGSQFVFTMLEQACTVDNDKLWSYTTKIIEFDLSAFNVHLSQL